MKTVPKKSKPTKNRKQRRALAKLIPVTVGFHPEELAEIDYFVQLVNEPGSVPEGQKPQTFNRNQVIRIATSKYMQGVLRKAREMSDEYRRAQQQGESNESIPGVTQATDAAVPGGEDSGSTVLAETADAAPQS